MKTRIVEITVQQCHGAVDYESTTNKWHWTTWRTSPKPQKPSATLEEAWGIILRAIRKGYAPLSLPDVSPEGHAATFEEAWTNMLLALHRTLAQGAIDGPFVPLDEAIQAYVLAMLQVMEEST